MFVRQSILSIASSALLLAACGSGGGGGTSAGTSATSALATLSGTAATGAAIANSTLAAKCSDASGSTVSKTGTTSATGTYTLTLPTGAALPCLVQVQITDGTGAVVDTLHGLAQAADTSGAAVVNINPITEGIVGAVLQTSDVESVFASPSSTHLSTLKTADTAAVWSAIKTTLTAAGVDSSAITGSPLSQAFSADSTGYDKVLDDFKAKGMSSEHLHAAARAQTIPPRLATGLLNDTGIDWCTENITTANTWVNHVVCSTFNWVANLWGQQQDAFFGRDAAAKAGTLAKLGSGMAGFDYTRIGARGRPLKIQNGTYSDTGTEAAGTKWDCVRDNVTGLMWEVKRNELVSGVKHLRHKDHSYTWYSTDAANNGSNAGTETGGSCTGVADTSKCNTQSYVTAVNATGICGFKDWRLPAREELRSLAHTGRSNPAIDTDYFPNTLADWYWSSSSNAGVPSYAWVVYFDYGYDGNDYEASSNYVRLVRSSQ